MKYLANTIVEHVARAADGEGTVRFVLPSFSAKLLLKIGIDLSERFAHRGKSLFRYGIAFGLGERWRELGLTSELADFERIRERGWYNETNNLTSLRNEVLDTTMHDRLVTLLAGYDHIPDRASLRDFHHLGDQEVWDVCLRGSFGPWIAALLQENGLRPAEYESNRDDSPFVRMNDLLVALYARGLADLTGISDYLTNLDLRGIASARDALRIALASLGTFNLPSLVGFSVLRGRKAVSDYMAEAQSFFGYGSLLEATSRSKAKSQIESYRDDREVAEPTRESLGGFANRGELADSLLRYVAGGSREERDRLMKVDFSFLNDQVLKHKKKRETRTKQTLKKLRGLPPEVFLRAVWLALGDYARTTSTQSRSPMANLASISLRRVEFKHDFEAGDAAGSGADAERDIAREFLTRTLGGVDKLLESHLSELASAQSDGDYADSDGREVASLDDGTALTIASFLGRDSCVDGRELKTRKSHTGEPSLRFEVVIGYREDGSKASRFAELKREFAWCLPRDHQTRILDDLSAWASSWIGRVRNGLPVFAAPYLPELFRANDDDEVTRLAGIAISGESRRVLDLLAAPGIETDDSAYRAVLAIPFAYYELLKTWRSEGFFAALDRKYSQFRRAYSDACLAFLDHSEDSCLGPLLAKAFAIVNESDAKDSGFVWQNHLVGLVATPLHPAVLEMVFHQHAFLCESFTYQAREALQSGGYRSFAERHWDDVADLAKIERPIFATLDPIFGPNGQVRSHDYIHRVGTIRQDATSLGSHLIESEDEDDEDVADTDLFRDTRAARLVRQTLVDYRKLHPHANDGLSVGAYCGSEIQPVIAGVDAFLKDTLDADRQARPYSLKVTFFSDNPDDSSVVRWLNAWRDRWEETESAGRQLFEQCRVAIAYRVVGRDDDHASLAELLKRSPNDVMLFTDFIRGAKCHFDRVDVEGSTEDGCRKFPIIEKAACVVEGGAAHDARERVLSHPRFAAAALHSEILARLDRNHGSAAIRHAVVSKSDFREWARAIDAAHQGSDWVVCIDPAIDEHLLRRAAGTNQKARQIIGFGTGVGAHGESNYTISTENHSLDGIQRLIGERLAVLLPDGVASSRREETACSLVAEASNLGGLSIVRATGGSEYVRDYIGYAAIRRLLPRALHAFCDGLFSLDAFSHWFDNDDDGSRPDLLRLRARIVAGYIEIEADVIECKFAQRSDGYLSRAHEQVEVGLRHLEARFRPRDDTRSTGRAGVDDRPDQRYWWMQLHRLVASSGTTNRSGRAVTLAALERLSDGYFSISWRGAVVAFWTDGGSNNIIEESSRELVFRDRLAAPDETLSIPAFTAASGLIAQIGADGLVVDLFANKKGLVRRFRRAAPDDDVIAIERPRLTRPTGRDEPSIDRARTEWVPIAVPTTTRTDTTPDVAALGSSALERDTASYLTRDIISGGDQEPSSEAVGTRVDVTRRNPQLAPIENGRTPLQQTEAQRTNAAPGTEVFSRYPDRVLLGTGPGDRDHYWEFGHRDLTNRHILIFGSSGTGKTYTIQAILCELARAGQNSLIVDYTDGFMNQHLEEVVHQRLKPTQHYIVREPLSINPFRRQEHFIDGQVFPENPASTAQRVAGVFSEIYTLGDQQKAMLHNTIRDGLGGREETFDLAALVSQLEGLGEQSGTIGGYATTVLNKIQPLVDMRPFGREDPESWERFFQDSQSRCHIVQLTTLSRDIQRLVTEFALIDLYRYYRARGDKDKPRVIVLDEIQNLDHRLESPLAKFLTEGRKFGISLILATQTLSNLGRDERDRLFQASHKLFFKPADTELASFAQIIADSTGERRDEWVKRLADLRKGECYSLGPACNDDGSLDTKRHARVRVRGLDERF